MVHLGHLGLTYFGGQGLSEFGYCRARGVGHASASGPQGPGRFGELSVVYGAAPSGAQYSKAFQHHSLGHDKEKARHPESRVLVYFGQGDRVQTAG